MAVKAVRWVKNVLHGRGPLILQGYFAAGSSTTVDQGTLIKHNAGDPRVWSELGADEDDTAGLVAVSIAQIRAGDLAGYHGICVPQDGDVFEAKLLSTDAQDPTQGEALYWSDSETVSTTAGTYVLGHVYPHDGYPVDQGFQSQDASVDRGSTLGNVSGGLVTFTIRRANSFLSLIQVA